MANKAQFFALTGAELKDIVLKRADGLFDSLTGVTLAEKAAMYTRVVREFDGDQRFEYHLTYPQVKWDVTLDVNGSGGWRCVTRFEVYPGEPATFEVAVQGGTWGASGVQPAVRVAPVVAPAPKPVVFAPADTDPSVEGAVATGLMTDAEIERAAGRSTNRLDEQQLSASGGGIEVDVEDKGEGWIPPEDRAAMAQEVERVARHNARLARQLAESGDAGHVGLEIVTSVHDRDEITKPNQARREAGLPVPKPQKMGDGQVVDVPLGEGIF